MANEVIKVIFLSIVVPVFVAIAAGYFTAQYRLKEERIKAILRRREEQEKGVIRAEIEQGLLGFRADFDRQLETLRHDLHREAVVHEVKFRKLYDKVSTVIEETFQHVAAAYASGGDLVAALRWNAVSQDELYNKFATNLNRLSEYTFCNRIFLPKRLWDIVNKFAKPLRNTTVEFQFSLPPNASGQEFVGHFNKAKEAFEATITPLYSELCDEMQAFIGLEEQPAKLLHPER